MDPNDTQILLFDGVCNLCNRTVHFIIKRDPKEKFKFSPLQSELGQVLLKKFGLSTNDFDSIIFIKQEECFLKSSAILMVLKELSGAWKLFYIFILVPRPLRDYFYDVFSKSRYNTFGKKNTCMVPTIDIKKRFLS